jgi:hypothetical protein
MIERARIIGSKDYRDGVKDALMQLGVATNQDLIPETSNAIIKEIDQINALEMQQKQNIQKFIDEAGTQISC